MTDHFSSRQQRERIFSQMERVRQSGRVNMVDAKAVQRVAYDMDLLALVAFMGQDPADSYAALLDDFSKWRGEKTLDLEHEYAERALDL